MDGFAELLRELLISVGIEPRWVYRRSRSELPGYYRAEKRWDLLVVAGGRLVATVEFKSQVGPSFGNNYNNRTEEALGNATDYWAAYREGGFRDSVRPWLGYLMLLEDTHASRIPVSVVQPHFAVFLEFRNASYAKRYEILLKKMIRERLYDAACLLLSPRAGGREGAFSEPCSELSFANFAESLLARAIAFVRTHQ